MHAFNELVQHIAEFGLDALGKAQEEMINALQPSASTGFVRALQMVQLQKAILAVGMFSMFDANLQDQLQCDNGFRAAGEILEGSGELALKESFEDLQLAINVLKHGSGRSYDALIQKAASLPFRVKLPGESIFDEGDVGEVDTLVEVDDDFVMLCAQAINEVALVVDCTAQRGTEPWR